MPYPFMFHIEGANRDNEALFAAVETAFKLHGPQYREKEPRWETVKSAGVISFPEQANRVWFPPKDKTSVKPVPTLILSSWDNQVSATNNLIPWTMEESCCFVQRWLTEDAEYPKDEPDTDGVVDKGYCIFLPMCGFVTDFEKNKKLYDIKAIILAVQPAWCVYGK